MDSYVLTVWNLFKKNEGRFNGWVSYTISKSEQRTPEERAESGINNGNW
jgi:hypothetical protein